MINIIKSNRTLLAKAALNKWNYYTGHRFNKYRFYRIHKETTYTYNKNRWERQFDKTEVNIIKRFLFSNLIYESEEDTISIIEEFLNNYYALIKKGVKADDLYISLSDGARFDLLRSYNEGVYNFQLFREFQVNREKVDGFVRKICQNGTKNDNLNIVLVDELIASGISFIRYENDRWKGKIVKVFEELLPMLRFYYNSIQIVVITYYGTEKGLLYLKNSISDYLESINDFTDVVIHAMTNIPQCNVNQEVEDILQKHYYLSPINDVHYSKGKTDRKWLGFNECSIMFVMEHNTPNNSFPIIWNEKGLFPRKRRHVEQC